MASGLVRCFNPRFGYHWSSLLKAARVRSGLELVQKVASWVRLHDERRVVVDNTAGPPCTRKEMGHRSSPTSRRVGGNIEYACWERSVFFSAFLQPH
ncbi:hypothetical protein M404DRAFT_1003941, partial [Pisolithus tinctorius Marx 270]